VSTYLVLLFFLSPSMGALVLGLGLLRVGLFVLTRRRQRDLLSVYLERQAGLRGYEVQMLAGIETLKASGTEHRAAEKWSNRFVDVMNASLDQGRLGSLVESLMTALGAGSPLVLLLYGGHLVLEGELTLGGMLAMVALAAGFLGPLTSLVATALQLQLVGSYLDRIGEVLDTPPEQDRGAMVLAHELRGGVEVEGVSFRYDDASPLVLEDVSLAVEPGRTVAVVGPSGSGKSTLARLMLGLYPPTSGRILFDGEELTHLDLRSVRAQVGVVPQQAYLFGSTIRENIALADPELSLADVIEAARRAHIHDEIEAMSLGYDTRLVDGGVSLSGGQRQRVALARALVRRPAILLLDEATSELDAVTERKIQRSLEAMRCTRVLIAHRLSTVAHADLILVLDEGRVVERGRHEGLLASGGLYAKLVFSQEAGGDAGSAKSA
jgi:ATP-binding cassette, subfamily B, bacterial